MDIDNKARTAREHLKLFGKLKSVRLVQDMTPQQVEEYAISFAKMHTLKFVEELEDKLVSPLFKTKDYLTFHKDIKAVYPLENIK